jgi:uncharacterized OB-fold protein
MPEPKEGRPRETNQQWIPVQAGLFDYPVPEGQQSFLLANQCKLCGKTFFPKRTLCPACYGHGQMEDISLGRRGVIYASTVVHIDSPSGIKAPYAFGYVDLLANQLRVFALFTGADLTKFIPGQEVEMVLEPLGIDREGQKIVAYKFRLT